MRGQPASPPLAPHPHAAELCMRELLRKYNSNRAPVGVYLHAARLVGSQDVSEQYSAFLRAALALPDVWVVTVSEVGGGHVGTGWRRV